LVLLKTQLEKAIRRTYLDNTNWQKDSMILATSDLFLQEIEEDSRELEFSLHTFLSDALVDKLFTDFMRDLQKH